MVRASGKPLVASSLATPERLAAQPYDIWHFQDVLFVIPSFEVLESEFAGWARGHRLL